VDEHLINIRLVSRSMTSPLPNGAYCRHRINSSDFPVSSGFHCDVLYLYLATPIFVFLPFCSSHAADNFLDPVYKPEMPREIQIRRRGKRGRDPFIDRWSQPFL
jgi:hypothetical protein